MKKSVSTPLRSRSDADLNSSDADEENVDIQVTDCSALTSIHGLPITREWLDLASWKEADPNFCIESDAVCILCVEKEGIYTRLSEDRFFDKVPCILG